MQAREGTAGVAPYGVSQLEDFVGKMRKLIDLEHNAEKMATQEILEKCDDQMAARKGYVLLNLKVEDIENGLLGKTLLTLTRKTERGHVLPSNKFSQNDVVCIRPNKGERDKQFVVEGVVYRLFESSITIAVNEYPDECTYIPLKIEKVADYITYDRLSSTLDLLEKSVTECSVFDVLFSQKIPEFQEVAEWFPINRSLDASQIEAVSMLLSSQDVALVHGPPGTGKTTTITEYICQEVSRGRKLLVCAASNVAVDNVVSGISKILLPNSKKVNIVRLGHPARISQLEHSLSFKVFHSDQSALARDCRDEIKQLNRTFLKLSGKDRDQRRKIRQMIKKLSGEERRRQKIAAQQCLESAQVICCTLSGAASSYLSKLDLFDIVVIDEAAQATEPACWGALLRGKRCVLAGDHLQLPPTIISKEASKQGLSLTLFERLHKMWGSRISKMLVTQYRMNKVIMEWSSREMYQGALQADIAIASQSLSDLQEFKCGDYPILVFIDTAGCEMEERREEDGDSLYNKEEANIVMNYIQQLSSSGIKLSDIGVVTPYSAQVTLLRSMKTEIYGTELEVSTVDGFQGREKEVIIISMVRSNSNSDVGFLSDSRRMNVAVTRAKKHCVLIGDSETIASDPFLSRLLTYFEENGDYQSAETYKL